MGDARLDGGLRPMRSRTFRTTLLVLAMVLPLTTGVSCRKGVKVQGANLKEKREKKRTLEEAQQQALDEIRRQEAEAAGNPSEQATSPTSPATQAISEENAPMAREKEQDGGRFPEERFSVTLRRSDGTTFKRMLFQPSFGYYQRTYLSGGGVRDQEAYALSFLFQRQLSRFKLKFRLLDRIEVLAPERARTRVRFRFHFKEGDSVDYPGEELFGASHPQSPFVQGVGPNGLERFPLFQLGSTADTVVVEIDFTP